MNYIETPSESFRLLGGPSPLNRSWLGLARNVARLTLAPVLAVLLTSSAPAQVQVAGQLLIDLNYSRGVTTATGIIPADPGPSVVEWTNYGSLGGYFGLVAQSAYAATMAAAYTNPPFLTNYGGITIPATPGSRMLVANFATPTNLLGSPSYSIEVWFYNANGGTGARGLLALTENQPTNGDAIKICAGDPASVHFNGNGTAGGLNWYTNGGTTQQPSTAVLHHGVITYNGGTGQETAYVDGVITDTTNWPNSPTNRLLNIGNYVTGVTNIYYPMLFSGIISAAPVQTSSSFGGGIAAVRVHTGVLSASAVSNNFALGAGAVPLPSIQVAGQLLINLNYTQGITTSTGLSTVAGETNVVSWVNYGVLGGEFDWIENSVYSSIPATYQNPPALMNNAGITAPESPAGSRLMVANFPTPAQLQGNVHYSVECWFYNLTTADPRGVFAWTLSAPPAGDAGELSSSATASWHNDANSLKWDLAATPPSTSVWHHGVITYDGITEKVYLDGVLSNSAVSALNFVATNAAGALANPVLFSQLISIPPTQSSSSMSGAIASLRVHTDALTAAQVANNFAAGISGGGAGGGSTGPSVGVLISPVTAITGTTATFNADLLATSSPATTGLTFFYDTTDHGSTTNGWAKSVTLSPPQPTGNLSDNITGLATGTTYYIRAYAFNSGASNLSSPTSFRTLGAPLITNSPAYFTGITTYGVNGYLVNSGDGTGSSDVILYWGTNDGKNVAANWQNTQDLGQNPQGTEVSNYLSGLSVLGNYYYTFAAANSYGTSFAQPSVSFQEGLIYAVNTTNQPAPGLTEVNAKTWVSQAGPPFAIQAGTPTVHSFGGAPWINSHYSTGDGFIQETVPSGTDLLVNGGSIVLAVKPTGGGATGNWSSLADMFFDQLTLAINPVGKAASTTHIAGFEVEVGVNNNTPYALTRVYIPSNVVTVISLVATPDDNFIVYTNGVVATNTLTGSNPLSYPTNTTANFQENGEGLTDLIAGSGGRGYADSINLLREDPDAFSVYNGYLGDVYCYGEALPDATRQALEGALMRKFVTNASLSYNLAASVSTSGTLGSITGGTISVPAGSGTTGLAGPGTASVVQGNSVTYTMTPSNGYAVNALIVDGTNEGVGITTYTFSNVSTNHAIQVQYVSLPQQQITATAGPGGNISPPGATSLPGGGSQLYTITPSNGWAILTVMSNGVALVNGTGLNGSAIPLTGQYTFANAGAGSSSTNNTIAVTFTQLSLPVPKSDQLILALDPAQLPQTNGTTITNWPVYVSNGLPPLIVHTGTPGPATFVDANNVLWERNIEDGTAAGPTSFQVGATQSTAQPAIPVNGFTITCTACPTITSADAGQPWYSIVDIFYGYGLGIRDDTGEVLCRLNVNNTTYETGYYVPNGTNEVLSLVVQPSGAFAVYANTVQIYTNAGVGPVNALVAGVAGGFANNIDIGKNQPDNWPGFNGLIGDVFLYATALSPADRLTLEQALVTKVHAVIPPNFNWSGANNADWSSPSSWTSTIAGSISAVPGANENTDVPTFSLSPASGQTVQLDQSFTVAGLLFNSNVANIVIASANGATLSVDSGSSASPSITLNSGASPTISAGVQVVEGLNIYGPGTLNVAGAFTLLGNAGTGYLGIAPDTSSTANVSVNGGTLTTYPISQNWTAASGPGVMLGGGDNSATHATLTLAGGILVTPSIGCVTENFTTDLIVPPATDGATAIVNLNGGVLQPSDNDSADPLAAAEGSAHLIFNTTHTWVQAGGARINSSGFNNSIAVPLEHFPGGPAVDGGLTKMGLGTLTLLTNSTYTGPTEIQAGVLACGTSSSLGANSVDIATGAMLELEAAGTTPVYKLTFNGGAAQPAGTYGATGSGAAHIDNTHFTGAGTLTVLGTVVVKPSFTSTVLTGGNLVLQGTGGIAGGTYSVLGSTNVSAPLSTWTTIATGTFTSGGFNVSVPVTNTVPQEFITLVVP